jgi:hypothetical protein
MPAEEQQERGQRSLGDSLVLISGSLAILTSIAYAASFSYIKGFEISSELGLSIYLAPTDYLQIVSAWTLPLLASFVLMGIGLLTGTASACLGRILVTIVITVAVIIICALGTIIGWNMIWGTFLSTGIGGGVYFVSFVLLLTFLNVNQSDAEVESSKEYRLCRFLAVIPTSLALAFCLGYFYAPADLHNRTVSLVRFLKAEKETTSTTGQIILISGAKTLLKTSREHLFAISNDKIISIETPAPEPSTSPTATPIPTPTRSP